MPDTRKTREGNRSRPELDRPAVYFGVPTIRLSDPPVPPGEPPEPDDPDAPPPIQEPPQPIPIPRDPPPPPVQAAS